MHIDDVLRAQSVRAAGSVLDNLAGNSRNLRCNLLAMLAIIDGVRCKLVGVTGLIMAIASAVFIVHLLVDSW
jgi:hypothetical protein